MFQWVLNMPLSMDTNSNYIMLTKHTCNISDSGVRCFIWWGSSSGSCSTLSNIIFENPGNDLNDEANVHNSETESCLSSESKGNFEFWKQVFSIGISLVLYVIIMSHTHCRVNLHSTVAWMSRNSLLKTGSISEV